MDTGFATKTQLTGGANAKGPKPKPGGVKVEGSQASGARAAIMAKMQGTSSGSVD